MSDAVIQEIRALEAARYAAMIAADVDVLNALLAEEVRYTHSNAQTDDKLQYLQKIRTGVFRYFEAQSAEEHIQVFGDMAVVTGRMVSRVEVNGAMRHLNSRFAVMWLKRSGVWQLLVFQPTPIPA
jgi:ketosteroid isomerase-like protein